MKSGGPWNLRGLRPEARAAAREAARRSGMSVGEWLNNVIAPADEDDEDAWWFAHSDERDEQWRPRSRYEERGRYRDAPPPRRREREPQPRRQSFDFEDEGYQRQRADPRRRRDREPEEQWRQFFDDDDREHERYSDAPRRRRREPDDQYRLNFHSDDRERPYAGAKWRGRDNDVDTGEKPVREGRPYREPRGQGGPYRDAEVRAERSRSDQDRVEQIAAAAEEHRDASIDKAVAEIAARQRALEGETVAPAPPAAGEPPPPPPPTPPPEPERTYAAWNESLHAQRVAEPAFDLGSLDEQLRQITARIEALRPSSDLETAINGLRSDLAEIGRSFTEALPRRALESLEIEVKALGQRIDHSRQSGVDSLVLAGIERGLTEVREALRVLTPAEGLVGFDDAIKELAKKVDAIAAKDDPAALQQLEAAISALRGIVSHVASNDTLTKVAEDVRALSAKVDALASSAPSAPTLSALENRIDILASALNASTEAGHAVPRELERLLSGLIEKLEWVQLTHTDRTALAHLEDRIASLVKRLDASDARLGLLEGVERGLADLLVYIEQLRGTSGAAGAGKASTAAQPIGQQVSEIKQTERRAKESLEQAQAMVDRVTDRLAMIESDMRGDRARVPQSEESPVEAHEFAPALELFEREPATAAGPEAGERRAPFDPVLHTFVSPRTPIDPSLPPDHPLEPGSAAGRSRQAPSAADRIAASEAAIGSKPPVIPDPGGGKPDFIAAARRAAQAAAATPPDDKRAAKIGVATPAQPKKTTERLRTLVVAGAVVVIVVGGFHIITRLFQDGSSAPVPAQTETPHVPTTPQVQTEPPQTQTEPRVQPEPRPPQSEPPHVEAEPLPAPAPAVALPAPDSVPSSGGPPLNSTSGPATGGVPGQQSLLNAPAAPLDITGSLAAAPAPYSATTSMAGDKLPLAIGGPALRLAALAGDPAAAYEVAVRFAEGRGVPANNEEAARWFEIAAKNGLAPAQFRLGTLYEKGLGVKKDFAAARDLYRAAAEKGHGKAMHNLAVLYAEGADGKADYRTAAQWFRKAADRGVTDSQYNLGILHARGAGVEQNLAEAYKWFFLAAKEGDSDAAQKRDEIAARLDQRTLTAARDAADKWTPVAQPAEAITVKGAWDAPAGGTPAAKPKPRSAKASMPDGAKIN